MQGDNSSSRRQCSWAVEFDHPLFSVGPRPEHSVSRNLGWGFSSEQPDLVEDNPDLAEGTKLFQAPSNTALDTFRDAAATASLGILFQSLTTLTRKNPFPIFHLFLAVGNHSPLCCHSRPVSEVLLQLFWSLSRHWKRLCVLPEVFSSPPRLSSDHSLSLHILPC